MVWQDDLREAQPGAPILAQWWNALVRRVRAITPHAGHGIQIDRSAHGVTISVRREAAPKLRLGRIVEPIGAPPAAPGPTGRLEGPPSSIWYQVAADGVGDEEWTEFAPGEIVNRAHSDEAVLIRAAAAGDPCIFIRSRGGVKLALLTEVIVPLPCEEAGGGDSIEARVRALESRFSAMAALPDVEGRTGETPVPPAEGGEEEGEMIRSEPPLEKLVDLDHTNWQWAVALDTCDEFTVSVLEESSGAIDNAVSITVHLSPDGVSKRSSAVATLALGTEHSGQLDPDGAPFAIIEIAAASAETDPRGRIVVNRRRTS